MPLTVLSALFKLYLLGPFRVENENGPVKLTTRKAQLLLAYLALNPQEHTREKLAALLWGDSPDAQARDSLRTALKQLRQQLGPSPLLADRETVQLNPAFPLWIDVREFEREIVSFPDSAVNLYHGELLADFYDEWILSEREHYRELYLDALLQLAQSYRAKGEYERAMGYANQVLTADPGNERAHQHLMFCYLALGDRGAALKQYDVCVRALQAEMGVEPSRETTSLYQWVKHAPSERRALAAQIANLPIPLSSFIGRVKELAELKELLTTNRLLTLTGAGGSGKTRLAIQVAAELVDRFREGVWWVDLSAHTDEMLVPPTVAQVLGVRQTSNQPVTELLKDFLHEKHLLLVLDNCEHLVAACAQLADDLLTHCPNLKILATSREAFGIAGELVYQVPTLSLPTGLRLASTDLLMEYEGIRLFVERARAVESVFRLMEQNAAAVLEICRRLDGIPLALELAAARTKVLSVYHIAGRLNDRFNLLTQGSRTALPRQQTLRAAIDWSYDLLPDEERLLFRRLSVFSGGFTLDAAEVVCNRGELKRNNVLDVLGRLVDKSLVIVEQESAAGETRYRLLETIRQYAQDKSLRAHESEPLRRLHLSYFLNLAKDAEPQLNSRYDRKWVTRVGEELDNLRVALDWGLRDDPGAALQIVSALTVFWITRGHAAEGRRWASEALIKADQFPTDNEAGKKERVAIRANALHALARIMYSQGDNTHAIVNSERAAALARKLGDKTLLASALGQELLGRIFLADLTGMEELARECLAVGIQSGDKLAVGLAHAMLGQVLVLQSHDLELGQKETQQGLSFLREGGNHWLAAMTILSLGMTAKFLGNYGEARLRFLDSLPMFQETGDRHRINIIHSELAHIERYEGHYREAEEMYRKTLVEWQALGHQGAIANQLECFAFLAKVNEQIERAARLFGAAEITRGAIAMPMSEIERIEYEREVADFSAHADAMIISSAWAEGRAMSLEQAIEYALEITKDSFTHSV